MLGSHPGVGQPQGVADFVKIDELVGGNDEHEESIVAGNDNRLSNLPRGQMLRRSYLAGRQDVGVVGEREFSLTGQKEITQLVEKRHNTSANRIVRLPGPDGDAILRGGQADRAPIDPRGETAYIEGGFGVSEVICSDRLPATPCPRRKSARHGLSPHSRPTDHGRQRATDLGGYRATAADENFGGAGAAWSGLAADPS